MNEVVKPIRIEPAFDDRESVRSLFERHAPYPAIAAYLPDGADDDGERRPADAVLPWFRSTWALGGEPLGEGVEPILNNSRFVAAARAAFGTSWVRPKTVVVNVNAPMPAGVPHVDVPSFRGATRENYPLRLLLAMGASGLFEPWRLVEAGAISWFYDGPGGTFDYWPEGRGGRMEAERPPFGNVAIVADNDRMYHRIGEIGDPKAALPRMSAAALIRPRGGGGWSIVENGEVRADYDPGTVRLSILWKAELFADERASSPDARLSVDQMVDILHADLRRRGNDVPRPTDPLRDDAWVARLGKTYVNPVEARPR